MFRKFSFGLPYKSQKTLFRMSDDVCYSIQNWMYHIRSPLLVGKQIGHIKIDAKFELV